MSHQKTSSRVVWAVAAALALGAGCGGAYGQEGPADPNAKTIDVPDLAKLERKPVSATEISFWLKKTAEALGHENALPIPASTGPELAYEKSKRVMRTIGQQFLEAGSRANDFDQEQGVYGMTLINNLEMFQHRMRRVIEDAASNDVSRVQGSVQGREAMDHMAEFDGKMGSKPLLENPADVEQHLTRYLADLYTISNKRADRATGNTWTDPVFACQDGAETKLSPMLDYYKFLRSMEERSGDSFDDRIRRLTERMGALKKFTAARTTVNQLLVGMQPAAIVPKFRARLDHVLFDMERLVEFMESAEKASWLPAGTVTLLEAETGKMMDLYMQPRDRGAASIWLMDLVTLRPGIEVVVEYRGKGKVDTLSLEAVINTAAGLNYASQPKVTRGRVMAWFNQFAGMLMERAQLAKTEPVPDYKSLVTRADNAFLSQVQQMQIQCRSAASRPASVEEPQAQAQLNVLRQKLLELRFIRQIPVWVQAGEAAKVQPSFSFARRFKSAADMVMAVDRRNATDAFDDLNQFNLQFSRYMQLPGEAKLREEVAKQGGKSSLPCIGDRGRALILLIDETRAAWLANWAKDIRPKTAGRKMFRLALLMRYIAAMESMRNWRHSVEATNVWPAVEVDPKRAEDPVKHALDAVTGAVVRVTDNYDNLMDPDLLSYDKVPWSLVVFAELGRQFRNVNGDRQWDMEWFCAELFYQPRETSWVYEKREALAKLSNAINAGAWRAFVFGTATMNPSKLETNPEAQFLRETDLAAERLLSQDEFLNLAQ